MQWIYQQQCSCIITEYDIVSNLKRWVEARKKYNTAVVRWTPNTLFHDRHTLWPMIQCHVIRSIVSYTFFVSVINICLTGQKTWLAAWSQAWACSPMLQVQHQMKIYVQEHLLFNMVIHGIMKLWWHGESKGLLPMKDCHCTAPLSKS